jgi:hypothetical protein
MTNIVVLERTFEIPTVGERYILNAKQLRRFMVKVQPRIIRPQFGECWEWVGAQNGHGYSRFYLEKRNDKPFVAYAHIVSYQHFVGPVPPRWIVDHMCEVHSCVKPDHLEAITNQENLARAEEKHHWKRRNQYSKE